MEYTESYYAVKGENQSVAGRKEEVCLANLCAYQFWQHVFKVKSAVSLAGLCTSGLLIYIELSNFILL